MTSLLPNGKRLSIFHTVRVISSGIHCASNHGAVRVDPSASWRGWIDHAVVIAGIAATTWVVASFVKVIEHQAIARFGGGDTGLTDADRHRRRVRTQVTVLRRLVIAIVVGFGLAAALMTFPSFTDIGKTLFASAGVLSVVAGLAAQTSLGAVSPASRSPSPMPSAWAMSWCSRTSGAASRRSR
jgi:hypothetical protein